MQAELEEAAEGQVADQEGGELVAAGRIFSNSSFCVPISFL